MGYHWCTIEKTKGHEINTRPVKKVFGPGFTEAIHLYLNGKDKRRDKVKKLTTLKLMSSTQRIKRLC